jgi:hypothetical protein
MAKYHDAKEVLLEWSDLNDMKRTIERITCLA